jgi:short-subunit dehydrogenase
MNILITGASRGIGFETVKKLIADDSNNVIAVSRDEGRLRQLKKECNSPNVNILPYDITGNIELLIRQVEQQVDSIDILINNAGALVNKHFSAITDEELYHIYNVNVFAPFRLIRSLLPLMGRRTATHILNISSMGGFQGSAKFAGLSAYSSSKAAIAGLTECMAEEFKDQDIRVNCLALGAVQTEMLEQAFPGYQAPVTAEQMAEYITHFALNGHKYYNGKILPVSLSTP